MLAFRVERVSKSYRIPHERHTTLVERLLSSFRPSGFETFKALDDVTFDVPQGAFVGLIGANGSGKSTLLKLMAGLLVPDSGQITTSGSVAPLLELGLGFHKELSVTENITLYGAVLGYPEAGMAARVEEVLAFAELERFRDAKLKNLSSGMLMRLAFATALRAEADILLLDEVLAVGDATFQQKCFDVFLGLKEQGRTIVLVSHDLASVRRFCDHVYWLDRGRLAMSGTADEVVQTYLAVTRADMLRRAAEGRPLDDAALAGAVPVHRWGEGGMSFVEGRLLRPDGSPVTRARAGERLLLELVAEASTTLAGPVFGFVVKQLNGLGGHPVYSTNGEILGAPRLPVAVGDRMHVRFTFTAGLMNGDYSVHVAVGDQGVIYDWINDYVAFTVEESTCHEGVLDLVASVECAVASCQPLAAAGATAPAGGRRD